MKNMIKKYNENRKGFVDTIFILFIIVLFLVTFLAIFIAQTKTNEGFQQLNDPVFDLAKETYNTNTLRLPSYVDLTFVIIVFGSFLVVLLSSYLLGNSPIFFIFYIIVSLGLAITGAFMEYFLEEFIFNDFIITYSSQLPMTTWIIDNLFILILVFILGIGVALFLKPKST